MDATEDLSVGFYAVTDDPTVAVRAYRRERLDRALIAIEGVVCAGNDYLERLVIFVSTNFACSHTKCLSRAVAFAAVSDLFSQAKIVRPNCSGRRCPGLHLFARFFGK
jgi:hypothetical protein